MKQPYDNRLPALLAHGYIGIGDEAAAERILRSRTGLSATEVAREIERLRRVAEFFRKN